LFSDSPVIRDSDSSCKSKADRRKRIEDILRKVDLGREYLFRKATQLSGGEMQRVAVARAFAIAPDLIVCDEPTSVLSQKYTHIND
jgi:peptide/nickel transport system ATP-binding protein